MKKYTLIAFDLDGTLTNPESGLIAGFEYAFDKMNLEKKTKAEFKKYIGPPLFAEWRDEFGLSDEEADGMVKIFREYYNVYGWWDNRVYDGVPEMLAALKAKGKRLAVATSKPQKIAERVLALFGLDGYFDFISGSTPDRKRDTKTEVLEYALAAFPDVSREECILVGDRIFDADGARACGIDSLGVLYGHGSRSEMESGGFTALVKAPLDVVTALV